MSTPSQEDYLEAIWDIVERKGYVRVTDIAERLTISRASVSKMIRKLKSDGLLEVERYRGLTLTPEGASRGKTLMARHQILERFLRHLAIGDPVRIHHDVEGVEHYVSACTVERLRLLVTYIDGNPHWWETFLADLPPTTHCP